MDPSRALICDPMSQLALTAVTQQSYSDHKDPGPSPRDFSRSYNQIYQV